MLRKFGLVTGLLAALWILLMSKISFPSNQASLLAFEALILLPLVWFMMDGFHRQVFRSFFGDALMPFRWQDVGAVFLALLLVTNGLDHVLALTVGQIDPTYIEESLSIEVIHPANSWWLNVIGVFLAVLAAPFVEEVVFRGLLFSRLSHRFGPSVGIISSSLLFGVIHADGFLGSCLFGVVMCLLFWHTKNIWLPIVLHILNNAIAVAQMYLDGFEPVHFGDVVANWPFYVACLLAIPALVIFIRRYWPPKV